MAKLIERRPGRRPHKLGERKDNTTAKLEEAAHKLPPKED
jgi:hypothetical protein